MKRLILLLLLATNCYASPMKMEVIEVQFGEGWGNTVYIYRANVPHGWLIRSGSAGAITFYPDERHEWRV